MALHETVGSDLSHSPILEWSLKDVLVLLAPVTPFQAASVTHSKYGVLK
jgi:hypothetical protein